MGLINVMMQNATGIPHYTATNDILFYPNPATGHFTIDISDKQKSADIQVADITGQIIYTTAGKGNIEINTKDFAAGIYFVQVKTSGFMVLNKMVIVK